MDIETFLKNSGQSGYGSWVVTNPAVLDVINAHLIEENLELLKQYAVVSLLNEYAPYLSKDFVQAKAKFEQSEADDQILAWNSLKKLIEMDLGELYAKRYFSLEKKQAVEKLIQDILAAYKKKIEKFDWLSEQSRAKSIEKLNAMSVKAGYPDTDHGVLKSVSVKSSETGGSYIENVISISKVMAAKELEKATAPVNRNEWSLAPHTINAYYDPSLNDITFPAAILQAPFYDEKASYAQNLGAIGAVIAHEITHAFDENGSRYDEKGNIVNWLTDEDRQAYSERARKVVDYFGSYEVLPGIKVNGELTLGENIADLGGVSTVSAILENDLDALKEMYRSYAMIMASRQTEDELRDQLESDEHAPSKVRVNGVLSSTDGFYRAFDLKPGDGMYLPLEKRVRLY